MQHARTVLLLALANASMAPSCTKGTDEAAPRPPSLDAGASTKSLRGTVPAALTGAESALSSKPIDCIACARKRCGDLLKACDSIAGSADAGPAAGKARSELCLDALKCGVRTGCAKGAAH